MRISDWSSDVCSSDLQILLPRYAQHRLATRRICLLHHLFPFRFQELNIAERPPQSCTTRSPLARCSPGLSCSCAPHYNRRHNQAASPETGPASVPRFQSSIHNHQYPRQAHWRARSKEHTSELQSLMRISYAVFCLKKKNNTDASSYTYRSI